MKELQYLFTQLQYTKKRSCSTETLASILKIQTSVQQDVPEFNNLLLNYIDDIFKAKNQNLEIKQRPVLKEYEGISLYQTKCTECETISSSKSSFLEIEISIVEQDTLQKGLDSFKAPEHLIGDNQYRCDNCDKLVDAKRRRLFQKLPPVLNFQLLRFIYDPETFTKKKYTGSFSFPHSIDLKKYCIVPENEENTCTEYVLTAVLLHLGQGATYGHYIAHIRDESSNKWWEFDDTEVRELSYNQVGVYTLHSQNENTGSINPVKNLSNAVLKKVKSISSENAYMLVYTKKNRNIIDEPVAPMECLQMIQESNIKLESLINHWNQVQDHKQAIRLQHREVYEEFMRIASVKSQNEEFHWISTNWLKQWISGDLPPDVGIDNHSLLCPHDKVAPNISIMKQISASGWEFLHEKYGGGPVLTKKDSCLHCAITLSDGLLFYN